MTTEAETAHADREPQAPTAQQSLATAAARNLATTTKSVPQMQGITSRWLLRMLPFVQVQGGTYRVNRRLSYAVGDGRITFVQTGAQVRVIPAELGELRLLRDFGDEAALAELAGRCTQRGVAAGEVIAERGAPMDTAYLVAHGRVNRMGTGKYGEQTALGVFADGQYLGDGGLEDPAAAWDFTAVAATPCVLLELTRAAFEAVADRSDALRAHVAAFRADPPRAQNTHGEAAIEVSAGHRGEPVLPHTFVDYEAEPREYELSVAQTVLKVHSRVADLYNQPMDQIGQQLRLTVEALRERQEHELVNNPEFGLLANCDYGQRLQPHLGPPLPDDLDELLARRRGSKLFLAHPKTIAAFGRECTRRGLCPESVEVMGHRVTAWRGVPIFPCDKIPISRERTSSVLVLRTGEAEQGVVGLHRTGLPDELEPGLNVRFMGVDGQALISYLVSAYYSAAILVPDAVGVLENVQISKWYRD